MGSLYQRETHADLCRITSISGSREGEKNIPEKRHDMNQVRTNAPVLNRSSELESSKALWIQ